jgi:hypothetical protein
MLTSVVGCERSSCNRRSVLVRCSSIYGNAAPRFAWQSRRRTVVAARGTRATLAASRWLTRMLGFTSIWYPSGRSGKSFNHPCRRSWFKDSYLKPEIPFQRAGCVIHKSGSVRGAGEQSPVPTRLAKIAEQAVLSVDCAAEARSRYQGQECIRRTCVSSMDCSGEFGHQMSREARWRCFEKAARRVFMGDGLPGNWLI